MSCLCYVAFQTEEAKGLTRSGKAEYFLLTAISKALSDGA